MLHRTIPRGIGSPTTASGVTALARRCVGCAPSVERGASGVAGSIAAERRSFLRWQNANAASSSCSSSVVRGRRASYTTTTTTTTRTTTTRAVKDLLLKNDNPLTPTALFRLTQRRLKSNKSSAAAVEESTVVVPSMGDSITEGTISTVMKSVGDDVATDEVVAQIETDKVTIDVRAPSAGSVTRVDAKPGDTVSVGQSVMAFAVGKGGGNAKKAATTGKPAAAASGGPPASVEVPSMGDSITEGAVATVLVAVGQTVAMDEVIAQIETDKVTIDVRTPTSGTVEEILAKEGDTVTVGQRVAVVAPGPGPEKKAAAASEPTAAAAPVKTAAAPAAEKPKTAPTPTPKQPTPMAAGTRSETRVPMSRLRQRVAERLKSSQNTYAMLTTFNEIDMSNIMQMRTEYKDAFLEKHGVKLGFMSAFVKAAAKALREEPSVNAIIDGDEIVYRNYVDISVAVSAPKGLVVPVLRNCETMNFADVERSIATYGKKARDGTLSIDEMAGGTFTISNGGVFGSLTGTPIINPPQSAILGMHSIVWRPVCVGPERAIVARPMMNVALTYDHRLVDGREAVTFLKSIKESVEDPRRVMLEL